MTGVKVVDASALAALLFGEAEEEAMARRLEGTDLLAPSLITYEVLNVAAKKVRQGRISSTAALAAIGSFGELGIELLTVDETAVLVLAERAALTAYDASYLWLARRLDAELVTLDARLARAAQIS